MRRKLSLIIIFLLLMPCCLCSPSAYAAATNTALQDTICSLGKDIPSQSVLLWLYNQTNQAPNENVRNSLIRTIATGYLLNTNLDFYLKNIRPLIKDVATFDRETSIPCANCNAKGVISVPCPKCLGSGKCGNCQGSGRHVSAFSNESLPCPWCNGGGNCRACNGSGANEKICPTCKGGKGFLNTGKLISAYKQYLSLAQFEISAPNLMETIVVIEGDKSVGTGFLSTIEGKKVVLSNAHVFLGNTKVALKTMSGDMLPYKNVLLVKDRDVAAYVLSSNMVSTSLEITKDIKENMVGDPVWVLGNSEGGGVVTTLSGKILAVGPNLLEINAGFVSGNSGSPIISHGKVIGVATFVTQHKKNWINAGTRFSEVRRFGVRVDNMLWANFAEINVEKYHQELQLLGEAQHEVELVVSRIITSRSYRPSKKTIGRIRERLNKLEEVESWTHETMKNEAEVYIRVINEILQYWDDKDYLG